jgi:hypothetical protein
MLVSSDRQMRREEAQRVPTKNIRHLGARQTRAITGFAQAKQ